jgi:hypothetical protein
MPLKLHPSGLGSGIDNDRPDYTVFTGEWEIGRIYQAPRRSRQSALVLVHERQRSDDALGPRGAPDRIGHHQQDPAHAVPVRLRQQMPAAGINPIVDVARCQLDVETEGSSHGALNASIPESRLGRASLQITGHGHYFSLRSGMR